MTKPIVANAPYAAAAAVVIAVVILIGFKMGVQLTTMVIMLLSILTCILAWLVFSMYRESIPREQQSLQSRTAAERLQSMVQAIPGGFAMFSPQGVLRETARVSGILGIEKLTHIEDIVDGLRDAADFVTAFRQLQLIGEGFSLRVQAQQDDRVLHVSGRRFRAGRDGPLIDILWFVDVGPEAQAAIPAQDTGAAAKADAELHALLEGLPFPVWRRGTDLRINFCNRAYAKALERNPSEVLREQAELNSQTARAGSGRALAANALSDRKPHHERRHVVIDGRRRLLEIYEVPVDVDGAISLLGYAIDVTGEEDKEMELQRHMAAQNEVLEHLGSAIAVYGSDTRLEFYNRAYQRLWDSDEAFLNSKPTFGEILEDLRTRRRAPEQADFQRYKKDRIALFTSLLEPREDLMYLPDGTSLRILSAPHPMGGIMFVHEDVTDKLALESSYNTLIAVQRETLDNLSEGIAVFGPDGKVGLYNPAYARIWNLDTEYLEKHPHVSDILERLKPMFNYGDNWQSFKNEMVEYTLDRGMRKGRIERPDQSVIEYAHVPLPDGAVLTSYLDVGDSVRVEQALRASNAALATADRLKSEFVANVSYQLRTPLNTIMGFAEILTNQYFGALNDRQLEYARTIMDASKKLLLLINDVLDLATIEAGRMTLNHQSISVADLLNTVKQMSIEWARQQQLEIFINCPSDAGSFEGDEHRLRQVLFNLISNSIKYTPSGGQITLEAKHQDNFIVLSVVDTGIGIPEADRDRVFGKFERTNSHARQTGAGLGLSLVKSFVELHGGRITISGNGQQGTRVSCYVPVHASTAATALPSLAS